MSAAGIIFASANEFRLPELTQRRVISSVPFGGRYRLIDFALSNMVNSGISRVGLITNSNYQSLLDHIGGGKDWDLARRSGGLHILPPFSSADSRTGFTRMHRGRLESLIDNIAFVRRSTEDYIVMTDGSTICNMDYTEIIREHEKRGADVTVVTKSFADPTGVTAVQDGIVVKTDGAGRVVDLSEYAGEAGPILVSTNIFVIGRQLLLTLLAGATAHGLNSFHMGLLLPQLPMLNVQSYEYDGFMARTDTLVDYFAASMALLKPEVREALFEVKNRPILTKVRNSAPVLYKEGARMSNVLSADGCVIEGVVENSILSRGVRIERGAVVRNSILLQDTIVGAGAELNCVVTDKNVVIRDGRKLSGHETLPFFIHKGQMV